MPSTFEIKGLTKVCGFVKLWVSYIQRGAKLHITDPLKFWFALFLISFLLMAFGITDCPEDWGCIEMVE